MPMKFIRQLANTKLDQYLIGSFPVFVQADIDMDRDM